MRMNADEHSGDRRTATWRDVADVFAVFLRIGATAFGGPAVHVAIMRQEIVERRRWIDEQHFIDLLGATNLIPGPNSSEMTMHVGYVRAGWRGLIAGGSAFLLPAMLITLALAWAYTRYGTTPAAGWLLHGIKPVIIPLIVVALWKMTRQAVKDRVTALVGVATVILYFLQVNFVILLIGGGVSVLLARTPHLRRKVAGFMPVLAPPVLLAADYNLLRLFLAFLKIGVLLYGSGYVLFAFLHADLVEGYGWLTEQQLIDAIAAGQITPGPLSSSATFIGYLLGGVPGALVATLGLYLPAFILVGLSNPLIPRIRRSSWAGHLLDGVNVAALGLMAAVTLELAHAAYTDAFTILIGIIAATLLLRYNLNSMMLVLLGAGMGLLSAVV
jgi:chromate transporter